MMTLESLKEELKISRKKYNKLVEETIKEHLHKKYLHAQIELLKIQKGMSIGKEYHVIYYGQELKVKRVISISEIPYDKIYTLNLSSMESVQPRMKIEVETDKGIVVKDVIYYAVKQFINPESINPNEYEF